MLKMQDNTTTGAPYTLAFCPVCSSSLQTLNTYRQVFLLGSILLSSRLLGTALQCTSCRRKFSEAEVRNSRVSTKAFKLDNGTQVSVTKTVGKGYHHTVTAIDTSEVFPKTTDDRTVAVTMAAILTVLARYNETMAIREHELFKYIASHYETYREDMLATVARYENPTLREATDAVIEQFRHAETKLTKTNLSFILRQTIKIVPDEFLFDSDEEDLFAELLKIKGAAGFELKAAYLDLRGQIRQA